MCTVYSPIVQSHSTETGVPINVLCLAGAQADDGRLLGDVGPIGKAMIKYAAYGGAVKLNYVSAGAIELVSSTTFALNLNWEAKRMLDKGVITTAAIEFDGAGEVSEIWLADRPAMDRAMDKMAVVQFQKHREKEKNMTPDEQLSAAIQKAYANPGILAKDSSIAPGAYARPNIEELNPPAKTPSRTPTAPAGTISVSELARANDHIRVIGEHLREAQRANPGSRQIADAGQSWYAITATGLGIDSRYMDGAQAVPVTPNSEALNEAIARSDRGFLGFRKALTRQRLQPQVFERVSGQVVSRSAFSKSAGESADDGSSEAAQLLRRHSFETALAHLEILEDKIKDAIRAVGPDSAAQRHLSAAHMAASKAKGHLANCLAAEDDD
jgi:hypothetical protein